MASLHARTAAASAVRAFLADVGAVYFGKIYDIKTDALSRQAWAITQKHFNHRCAYCHTPATALPRGVKMTMEHLIEQNQWQCGLHHPGNTVPACSSCNGSRDKAADGSRLTWEQHLQNLGKSHQWSASTVAKRRKLIQAFLDQGVYPEITKEEFAYLQKTAQELYQDVLKRCTAGTSGFVAIHGASAVRIKPISPRKASKISPSSIHTAPNLRIKKGQNSKKEKTSEAYSVSLENHFRWSITRVGGKN